MVHTTAADQMEVAFLARTESCTFLLDADGVCTCVLPAPDASPAAQATAERCIGAQYVATLDPQAEGLLAHDPTAGLPLLFARVGENLRVSLVRSGPLIEFHALEPESAAPVSMREPIAAVEGVVQEAAEGVTEIVGEIVAEPDEDEDEDEEDEALTGEYLDEARAREPEEHAPGDYESGAETVPFSRERPSRESLPETTRGPATVRAFPPPPTVTRRGVLGRAVRS